MSGLISSPEQIRTRTWSGHRADGGPPSEESGERLTRANWRLMSGVFFFGVGAPTGRLPLHLVSPVGAPIPNPRLIRTNLINTLTGNTWAPQRGGPRLPDASARGARASPRWAFDGSNGGMVIALNLNTLARAADTHCRARH